MSDTILETRDLTKSFGALTANDKISLEVEAGEVHAIIGPNGSGKSTFFNTVTGFYTPDGGAVVFDGDEITGWRSDRIARHGLGRTFQIASPFEDLTARENLLGVYTEGIRSGIRISEEKRARADEILDLLEISHIADHEASDISGGQQKLLELGRILMLEPACVLLDEPTAGVNPALQQRILEHLQTINDRGITFVLIEHDMSVIATIADRVSVFDQGRIITQGTFGEVTADPRVREAYLGKGDDHSAGLDSVLESGRAADAATAARRGATASTAEAAADGDRADGRLLSGGPVETDAGADSHGDPAHRLVATDIVTGYGNHTVIDGVSVESRDGITCIFGPNGSGKSTLLKCLAGVVPAWTGRLTYRGDEITRNGPHENVALGVAMVPQDGGIFGRLSVEENLLLGAYTVEDEDAIDERTERALAAFPALKEKLDARGDSLSGGQQMMLSFARAMMTGADVYLLDEPSAGLAPALVDDAFEMATRLVDHGAQVVLIEQNVREALRIADHVYILAQGRIQYDGDPGALADEDELVELYLGLD
ncbi:ATP-binding cassette domain-containing protein [Haloferacaceae archaeon DSL9]